jgi:hypothetical protein
VSLRVRTPRAPAALPLLERGSHRSPSEGSCLMEYVSVLSGARFSDRPRCTHPLLGRMARLVNDTVDDDDRAGLVRLAPELVGTRRRDGRVGSLLLGHLALAGLAIDPDDARLGRVCRRARAYSDLRRKRTTTRRLLRRGLLRTQLRADVPLALQRVASLALTLEPSHRDAHLVGMLRDSTRSVRTFLGYPQLSRALPA